MLEQLEGWRRRGLLRDVDVHFARLLARLGDGDEPEVMLAGCLASHWTGQGHVCVDLRLLAGAPVLEPLANFRYVFQASIAG